MHLAARMDRYALWWMVCLYMHTLSQRPIQTIVRLGYTAIADRGKEPRLLQQLYMGVLWLLHGSALLHGSEVRAHARRVERHHDERRY